MQTSVTARLDALGLSHVKERAFVADCTGTARFGLRAKGSANWFEQGTGQILPPVNRFSRSQDGLICLRLGMNDITLSGPADRVAAAEAAWTAHVATGERCGVNGYRQDTWAHLAISGPAADSLMAQLTEIDLREAALPVGAIAQTRMLHVDTVILRSDFGAMAGYELFFDIATKPFVLESLQHLAQGYHFATAQGVAI